MRKTDQVRLVIHVPRRVREFFQAETRRLSERDQMPWSQGRLLTHLVDERLRQKNPSPRDGKVE